MTVFSSVVEVTIDLLAILIAVLLPALGMARSTAQGLSSLSRMRQVQAGWAIWTGKSDRLIVSHEAEDEVAEARLDGEG